MFTKFLRSQISSFLFSAGRGSFYRRNNGNREQIKRFIINFNLIRCQITYTLKSGAIEFLEIIWYYNNKIHRNYGLYGTKYQDVRIWYKHGISWRGNGLPTSESRISISWFNGNKKLHREELDSEGFTLPAIIYVTGHKQWWKNGDIHRDDGPAKVFPDGYKEFWVNGEFLQGLGRTS